MKKTYQKPEIMFEDFSLSTNIAGDCEGPHVHNPAKGSCGIPGSNGTILFSSSISDCNFDWMAFFGDDYNGLCYHVPTETSNLFNS